MELSIRPRKAVLVLGLLMALLVAAHLASLFSRFVLGHSYVFGLVPLFDLDRENNIPSLYSAMSLVLCSGLLAIEAAAARQGGNRDWLNWTGLSFLFLFFAVDEQFALHERLILPLQRSLGVDGYLYFAWVIPYSVITLVLGIACLQFLLRLPPATRGRFLVAAVLFLAGALGLEMLGGEYYERLQGSPDLLYVAMTTVEELCEMGGVLLFIHALLADMAAADVRLRLLAAYPAAASDTAAQPETPQLPPA